MASSLVESLASDFDPDQFTDEYAAALREMIDAKVTSGEVRQPAADTEESGGGAEVVDLLTALQRSVDRARSGRGESADDAADTEEKAPTKGASKKAPAKRSTAKKTAATTTTAKKSATKKSAKKVPAKKAARKSA